MNATTKIVATLSTALVVVGLAGRVGASPAQFLTLTASPQGDSCAGMPDQSSNPCLVPGAISAPVPAQVLENKLTTISHPASERFAITVPAGKYSIEQGSLDDAHPLQEDQPLERWYAVFFGPDGVVGTTSTTPDLATSDVHKVWRGDDLVLVGPATAVVYYHAPEGEGPDSVYPNLLRLTPVAAPETTTTTAPPTTTTIPLTSTTQATTPPTTVTTTPSTTLVITPVAVLPDQPQTTTPSSPPTTAASTTTPPTTVAVEIKGIEVSEPPTTIAPAVGPEIAFTGSNTRSALFAGIVLTTLGAFLVLVVRRRSRS